MSSESIEHVIYEKLAPEYGTSLDVGTLLHRHWNVTAPRERRRFGDRSYWTDLTFGPRPFAFVGSSDDVVFAGDEDVVVTPHPSSLPDDLLIVLFFHDGVGVNLTAAAGFTVTNYNATVGANVARGTHDGSASYAFPRAATGEAVQWICLTFSGAAYDTQASAVSSTATPSCSAVTPAADALVVAAWGHTEGESWGEGGTPTGFTDVPTDANTDLSTKVGVSDDVFTGGVTTGAIAASSAMTGGARNVRRLTVSVIAA
jgi:hypothetical protein